MREIFTSGSVGGAPGNRCFYLEADAVNRAIDLYIILVLIWKKQYSKCDFVHVNTVLVNEKGQRI